MPPSDLDDSTEKSRLKLIAFFLTQFHPIPENDEWWGKGFTEWANVTKASPLFDGHYQPKLPADLGFYDLRLRATRHAQIHMAKQYGIDGFCYHYYWFSGKRLLEAPLEDMLADPESEMPFCLCWANENWTRRWLADEQAVLIEQRYQPEDARQFACDVARYLRDPRYIECDGRPLLVIYRPQQIPDVEAVVRTWREQFRVEGIGEVHLCAALTHNNFDYEQFGFDSGVEFPPHNRALLGVGSVNSDIAFFSPFKGAVVLYHELAQAYLAQNHSSKRIFRGVFPAWDNTARSQDRAMLVLNGTPENYEFWLSETIRRTREENSEGSQFVFINAWNEWAEGCYLEPDQKYRTDFLDATLRAKTGASVLARFSDTEIIKAASGAKTSFWSDLNNLCQRYLYLLMRRVFEKLNKMLLSFPRIKRLLKSVFSWY